MVTVVCPGGNAQPRGRGLYRGRERQITWRTGGGYRGGAQTGSRRDPNTMDIDRRRGGDRTCYMCRKWGHMARNCWEKHKGRVVEMPQESAKENGGQ